MTVIPLFQKKVNEEYVEILGDYDVNDARIDQLLAIYFAVKKNTEQVTTMLLSSAEDLQPDSVAFDVAKAKDAIVSCYAHLEHLDLDCDPDDSRENYREHIVFSRLAWFLIPLLLRLDAQEEAQDLFRAVKIKKIRDGLEDKYWQLQYPAFDR